MDIYKHSIPFCYTNHWAWKTSIDDQQALAEAQPRKVGLLQLHRIYINQQKIKNNRKTREREREKKCMHGTYNKVMVMDEGLSQGKERAMEKQKGKKG
jgi:hypothetical protein